MSEAEAAEKLVWIHVANTIDKGEVPLWVMLNTTTSKSRLVDGRWLVTGYLFFKKPLGPHEAWEKQPDGSRVVGRTNPATGERRVVLSNGEDASNAFHLFKAKVRVSDELVEFVDRVDIGDLNAELFDIRYK